MPLYTKTIKQKIKGEENYSICVHILVCVCTSVCVFNSLILKYGNICLCIFFFKISFADLGTLNFYIKFGVRQSVCINLMRF